MYKNLKIVKVDYRYCDYLRKFDNKVDYNAGNKELRPFIGVLFEIENMKYLHHYQVLKKNILAYI